MPCYYTGTPEGDRALAKEEAKKTAIKERLKLTKERLKLTRLLCEACKLIESMTVMPEDLRKWWNKHNKQDKKGKKNAKTS